MLLLERRNPGVRFCTVRLPIRRPSDVPIHSSFNGLGLRRTLCVVLSELSTAGYVCTLTPNRPPLEPRLGLQRFRYDNIGVFRQCIFSKSVFGRRSDVLLFRHRRNRSEWYGESSEAPRRCTMVVRGKVATTSNVRHAYGARQWESQFPVIVGIVGEPSRSAGYATLSRGRNAHLPGYLSCSVFLACVSMLEMKVSLTGASSSRDHPTSLGHVHWCAGW